MFLPNEAEELVFESLVTALFLKALQKDITPKLKDQLRGIGLDLDSKIRPAYPRRVWESAVRLTAQSLYPGLSQADALKSLAGRMMDHWKNSFLGKAQAPMLKLLGPKRTLARSQQNFRIGTNYAQAKYTEVGSTEAEVWLNEPSDYRYYVLGVMEAGVKGTGVKDVDVSIAGNDARGTTYRIRWTA